MFASYPFTQGQTVLMQNYATPPSADLQFQGISNSANGFQTTQGTQIDAIPGRLRVADLNSNSYPDVVLTLQYLNTTSAQPMTTTTLLFNQEANKTITNGNPRELVPITDADDSLYYSLQTLAGQNTQFATFLDIASNGRLDVILQKIDANGVP